MNTMFFLALFFVCILAIAFSYYKDYASNPKEFKTSLIIVLRNIGIIVLVWIFMGHIQRFISFVFQL